MSERPWLPFGSDPLGLVGRTHDLGGLFVQEVRSDRGTPLGDLVLIPGGFHGAWAFDPWMPLLAAEGWRCLALSLRGHSGSAPISDSELLSLSIWDYLDDVQAVLRWVGGHPVLLGHSMGGLLAQMAGRGAAGLVLVSAVGPGQLGKIRDPFPVHQPLRFSPEAARALWFHTTSDEVFREVYERMTPESPTVLNSYSDGSVRLDTASIKGPVLAVGAEFDRTPVHRAELVAGLYGGDWWVVPGCGHDLMFERASLDVARAIAFWLRTRVITPVQGVPWSASRR